MILIKKGQIGLIQNGYRQEIYPSGRHVLLSPESSLVSIKNETESVISHGTIKIIQVKRGELGYGIDMEYGKPVLLSQGRHIIKSNSFVWRKFITLKDPRTALDNLEIIRVEKGNIGYCYRSGKLDILNPGFHLITPPDRFGDFLSTQIIVLSLPNNIHFTNDYIPIAIEGSVFYKIMDIKKALLRVQNIKKHIIDVSVATIAGIIRASSFHDLASNSKPFYETKESEETNDKLGINISDIYAQASAPPFSQHIQDEFLLQLHDHIMEEWGIDIQNIRIDSLKISDKKLQTMIGKEAVEVQKQHNRFIMLQKHKKIVVTEAETRLMKHEIEIESKINAKIEIAKAEADSVIIKAKAKKEAKRLSGEGEKEYCQLLEETDLGKQLAIMKIQSGAMKGLKQVAYVPHLPSLLQQVN